MATKFNDIRNRITADNRTGAAFQAAGRDATKYGRTSAKAAEIARKGFRATAIAITAVVTASTAAVAASFRLTQSQARVEDEAGKVAGRLQVSVEELTRYNHVAGLSGLTNQDLEKSFQRLPKSISDAGQNLSTPVRALEQLNLTVEELKELDTVGQFEAIALAMQGVSNQSDRVRIAQDLMGRSGVKMLQIINQGTEAIEAMKDEADLLGITITGEAAASAAAFNDEMLRLQSVATGIIRIFTNELKPIFTVIFREAKLAMLDNREEAQDFAATIQDRVVGALRMALEVMRFFHNAWLGIKLVGSAALVLIAHDLEILLQGLRVLLVPLDLIFEGLVKLGKLDVNPFDTAQNALADFTAATTDQTAQVLKDIEDTNAAYDKVGQTIDGLTAKINAQREANQAAGGILSSPQGVVQDPRVEQEKQTQAQLLQARQEAIDIALETERAFDANLESIHQDQVARKQKEMDLAKASEAARRTQINAALGNLAEAARASNASFETQKKIAIAQALVGTYQATVDAYRSAGNPYLGVVLAAAAFAANIAQVNKIRRTKPGSTGAEGSTTTGGALPSSAAAAAPAPPLVQQTQQPQQTLILQIEGDLDPDMITAKIWPSISKFNARGTMPGVQIQGAQ
jgi:hypothetical protein